MGQQSEANMKAQKLLENQKAMHGMYFDQKGRMSQQNNIHSNSQTLAVDKNQLKKKPSKVNATHAMLNKEIQNQSENILAKLQSLLVTNKEDERKSSNERIQKKLDKRGKQLNQNQRSQPNYDSQNQRKSANSIGSQNNRSNPRISRYSQNSKYSRSKSKVSRSKSSKKSSKSRQLSQGQFRSKTQSNERQITGQHIPQGHPIERIGNRTQAKQVSKYNSKDRFGNLKSVNNSVIVPS